MSKYKLTIGLLIISIIAFLNIFSNSVRGISLIFHNNLIGIIGFISLSIGLLLMITLFIFQKKITELLWQPRACLYSGLILLGLSKLFYDWIPFKVTNLSNSWVVLLWHDWFINFTRSGIIFIIIFWILICLHKVSWRLPLILTGLTLTGFIWGVLFKNIYFIIIGGGALLSLPLGVINSRLKKYPSKILTENVILNTLMVIGSLTLLILIFEISFSVFEWSGIGKGVLYMPKEWQLRLVGNSDFFWHGHLHRYNSKGFRGPDFKPKTNHKFRIVTIGDSITEGYGEAEAKAWPLVLHARLAIDYDIEVINLGKSGRNSQWIAHNVNKLFAELQPDLIIYGMCLNDFQPEYRDADKFVVLPAFITNTDFYFQSKMWQWLEPFLRKILILLGLNKSYYEDALLNIEHRVDYFWGNMRQISKLSERCKAPVIGMVVTHNYVYPHIKQYVNFVENLMNSGGLIVVPAQSYLGLMQKNRRKVRISHWEGHPNAYAHQLFAENIHTFLLSTPIYSNSLYAYKR